MNKLKKKPNKQKAEKKYWVKKEKILNYVREEVKKQNRK